MMNNRNEKYPQREKDNATKRLNTKTMMEGARKMILEHAGQDYLLRITKQGKLILTK
jgi:hemin uptake protein HemP